MNKIGIYGIIKKIIDSNKLIYILESEELSFIINGTKFFRFDFTFAKKRKSMSFGIIIPQEI